MEDLEEAQADFSEEEYADLKTDTLEQIQEFEKFLLRQQQSSQINEAQFKIEQAKDKAFGIREL